MSRVRSRRLEVLRRVRTEYRDAEARRLAAEREALAVAERAVCAAQERSSEVAARSHSAHRALARMAGGLAMGEWHLHHAWRARLCRERQVLAQLEGALRRAVERREERMSLARWELFRAQRAVESVLRLEAREAAHDRTVRERAEE